ncbi:MAG: dTDP-4-dehydrorhamnose reductase [Betaproteobacteria bacterium]|nr:dTDP-4-dehydrorhamnose reductase [Betaproteobacteria bacterium]
MLGHRLLSTLSRSHEVRVTLRRELSAYRQFGHYDVQNSYSSVDVRVTDRMIDVLADFHPDAVINAVGVVKQRPDGLDPIPNLEINALLPHRLVAICKAIRAHFIHISTDCVFSGRKGSYKETDEPDPIDVYGHSKLLGEVVEPGCITLRTSIIGRELARRSGLFEWFLMQKQQIKGYKNAIFSGFTTIELSRVIEKLIAEYPTASGIYHVSSYPISKYDLLNLIKQELKLPIEVTPNTDFKCNRSLDSTRFRKDFDYEPPTWKEMIEELVADLPMGTKQ